MIDFGVLKGKILTKIEITKDQPDKHDKILFYTADGELYKLYHDQDCCENVYLEDIWGDINNLLGENIFIADVRKHCYPWEDEVDKSWTWSFYELATIKGSVSIRWYGESNGCYSEEVDLIKLDNKSPKCDEE